MFGPLQEGLTAMQSIGRWFYLIGGLMWLGAFVLAGIRVYQICTQLLVPAVVLDSRLLPHWETSHETDMDGFARDTASLSYYRLATVRYEVNGKSITAELGQSGSGFRWIEELVIREWRPGARIRVRINPARPDKPSPALGLRYSTFAGSFGLLFGGFCFAAFGYGIVRVIEFALRKLQAHLPARAQ